MYRPVKYARDQERSLLCFFLLILFYATERIDSVLLRNAMKNISIV